MTQYQAYDLPQGWTIQFPQAQAEQLMLFQNVNPSQSDTFVIGVRSVTHSGGMDSTLYFDITGNAVKVVEVPFVFQNGITIDSVAKMIQVEFDQNEFSTTD